MCKGLKKCLFLGGFNNCNAHCLTAIIPFGWAQDLDDSWNDHQEIALYPGIEINDRATLKGSAAAVKALNSISPISDQSYHNQPVKKPSNQEEENPHEIMAIEMTKTKETSDSTAVLIENDISSDIFDESLRYSGIDRPRLNIEYAENAPSEEKQIRGEFISEEERIANLFTTSKKRK